MVRLGGEAGKGLSKNASKFLKIVVVVFIVKNSLMWSPPPPPPHPSGSTPHPLHTYTVTEMTAKGGWVK